MIEGKAYPIKAILFDKDGTLLDFVALWGWMLEEFKRKLREQLLKKGLLRPVERLQLGIGEIENEEGIIVGYDPQSPFSMGHAEDIEAILAGNLYRFGLPWNEAMAAVRQCWQAVEKGSGIEERIKPMPGLRHFLQQCAQSSIPMAVVTADRTAVAKAHLKRLAIETCFGSVIGHDQVTKGKPDPEMIQRACTLLGVEPAETAIIGDSNGDMLMGKQAGAAVRIGIVAGGTPQEKQRILLPDAMHVITDFGELRIQSSGGASG